MVRRLGFLFGVLFPLAPAMLLAQGSPGRIFYPTPETVSIFEFNELTDVPDGGAVPEGTVIPDHSGLGHNAVVESNAAGDLTIGPGDEAFDNPAGSNRECKRGVFTAHQVRVAVNDDEDAFEMGIDDDFTVELYVNRESVDSGVNWGILAGTWHSRNLLDDAVGTPDADGAWYGYGLIRNDKNSNPPAEWSWVLSPVVDGVPRLGFDEAPEQHLNPFFDIPEGRHYVVLSVNRTDQTAIAYVDGVQVASRTLDPTWSFTTPDGYEHARFLMYSGEDDPTRGQYRGSPEGTHLDAVRVQRRSMTPEEVLEVYDNIVAGRPSPQPGNGVQAALAASTQSAVVGQCVKLSAETSFAGEGKTITKYEWKVGGGAFVEGDATREVLLDTVSAEGVEILVRVTNSANEVGSARVNVKVRQPPVMARIDVSLNGQPVRGNPLIIPRGSVLTFDGTGSTTVIPVNAFVCPVADGIAVEPSPITEYRWDLDGRLVTVEDTRPSFDSPPFETVREVTITLSVKNAAGESARTSFRLKVVEAGRSSRVFGNTEATVVHFELDGSTEVPDGSPIPNDTVITDLSGNGYHAVVEANDGGDLVFGPGSPIYDKPVGESREVQHPVGVNGQARLAINDDGDAFEMGPTDDFSVELFVDRETVDGGANWGILAGTWHSRNLLDDGAGPADQNGAWYGFGLIRNDKNANPPSEWSWVLSPVVDGVPRIGFGQQPEQHLQPFFDIPVGRHYVVLSVDRLAQVAVGYVDGVAVTRMENIPPEWSLTTPDGYEHARFLMFSGEDDASLGAYRGAPAGTHLDAVRVQRAALTPEEVSSNWTKVCAGDGTGPEDGPTKPSFHRGDADDNGQLQLTDAVRILGFLFLGGPSPTCLEAADADDNGQLQLTDAVRILGFLFLGGAPPSPPGPPSEACGTDPVGSPDVGCESYESC